MTAVAEQVKTIEPRRPTTIKLAEHQRNVWSHVVEHGVDLQAILKPDFWAHVARSLRAGDRVELLWEDMSYFAELVVLQADRTWAKVCVLRAVELTGNGTVVASAIAAQAGDDAVADEYIADFKGPTKKFCIIRVKDKVIIKEGIATKVEAQKELADYLQTVGR